MATQVAEDRDSDVFRHLFILDTPSHRPDLSQYWRLQLASALRKRLTIFADAPHGYYIVDDDRSEGQHEILGFFEGEDVYQALRDLRQARRSEPPVSDAALTEADSGRSLTEASPMSAHSRRVKGARQGSPYHGSASHASSPTVPTLTSTSSSNPTSATSTIPPPPPVGSSAGPAPPPLSSRIIPSDCNSLIPLTQGISPTQSLGDALYTMRIKVNPSHVDMGVTGMDYILPIDTGSSPTWFFRSGFQRLVITNAAGGGHDDTQSGNTGGPRMRKLSLQAWNPPDKYNNRPSVLGVDVENTDFTSIEFVDTGMALLQRYPPGYEILALIPSWDWKSGRKAPTQLRLPRVLAYAGNDFILAQYFDGNLGLSLPGYTIPFDRTRPSTFFDAISASQASHGEGSHVKEPTRMTLRLLHPSVVTAHCPYDVQSYLLYGMYWPCAVNDDATGTTDQNLRVPTFTPRIRVIPTANAPHLANQNLDGPNAMPYGQWSVLLDSIALLVPNNPRANREAPVPCRNNLDDWTTHVIKMIATVTTSDGDQEEEQVSRPLPVILDTCSSFSILPDDVCATIGTEWLGIRNRVTKHLLRKRLVHLFVSDELDIDDCDIRFTFLGEGGSEVHFQCSAGRFLKTLFPNDPDDGGGVQVPVRAQSLTDRTAYSGWTLGQNFFWTAFVQFESTFQGDATIPTGQYATENYVRLAPQRVPDATGTFWLGEEAIRFHKLPGRLEAERLKSAGLRYDD